MLIDLGQGRYRIEHPLALNVRDGSLMVCVPDGDFEMGDGKDGNCPKHRVDLPAFWIGAYAVSNAQYLRFVEATGYREPDLSYWSFAPAIWNGRSFPKGKADHPVVCVDWEDAAAYASWAGCQLPTEAQWEKAARGPRGLIYPWGDAWDASRCRHDKNRGNETTCAVQGYPKGVSGYGTYQQSGNVWEWCADWYDDGYYGKSPERDPRGPEGGSYRVHRGGSWGYGAPDIFRGALRNWFGPGYRSDNLGFRLVRTRSGPLPS
jgi:sulfatase modifying factor 1